MSTSVLLFFIFEPRDFVAKQNRKTVVVELLSPPRFSVLATRWSVCVGQARRGVRARVGPRFQRKAALFV